MVSTNYNVIKSIYRDYVIIYFYKNKYIYLDNTFRSVNLDKYNINYLIFNNDIEIVKIKSFDNNRYFYYYKRLKLINMIWSIYERLY